MPRCLDYVLASVLLLGCGDDEQPTPTPRDTNPPARISDLSARETSGRGVLLGWTAPGDDGAEGLATRYDLRRFNAPITSLNWAQATPVESAPAPQPAGRLEQLSLEGLALGSWYFAVVALDEMDNSGELSNLASLTLADTVPPSAVSDFAVGAVTTRTIELRWTAPGGDGTSGRATSYELRRSDQEINEQNWDSATPISGLPTPAAAGAAEAFVVTDLQPNTTAFLALKSHDDGANVSILSNVVSATTLALNVTRLTFTPSGLGAASPDWSHDGSRIAFHAYWDDEFYPDLYTMAIDGSDVVQATETGDAEYWPRWSPTSDALLCVAWKDSADVIWREIQSVPASAGGRIEVLLRDPGQRLGSAAWSPSGDRILYTRTFADFPARTNAIYSMDLATGATDTIRSVGDAAFRPDWSPDGARIVFNADRSGDFEIYSIAVDGSDERQLTDQPGSDGSPRWSPDGTKIAFSSARAGDLDLWVMNADGSDPTRLTTTPDADGQPAWSPDGTRIAFVRSVNNTADIWVLELGD